MSVASTPVASPRSSKTSIAIEKAKNKAGIKLRRLTSLAKVKLNKATESKESEQVNEARNTLLQTRKQISDLSKLASQLYNAKLKEYKCIQELSSRLLSISPSTEAPKMIKGTKIDRDKWLSLINLIGETSNYMETPFDILLTGKKVCDIFSLTF